MAIELGTTSQSISQSRVTWRIQLDSYTSRGERIADPTIEIFRALKKQFGEDVVFTPDAMPVRVEASELASLAEFSEIPSQLATMIPTQESLTAHLAALPLLIAIACDAAERKAIVDAETAAEQKAIADEEAAVEAARIAQVQAASLAEQDLPQE